MNPIAAEYLHLERKANADKRNPRGADVDAIITRLAGEHGVTLAEVRRIVLNATVAGVW